MSYLCRMSKVEHGNREYHILKAEYEVKFMRLLTMVAWFSVVSVSLSAAEKDKVWPDIPLGWTS